MTTESKRIRSKYFIGFGKTEKLKFSVCVCGDAMNAKLENVKKLSKGVQ